MTYILNARSKTVHRADSTHRRCSLQQLDPENAMEFDSLEEALSYFPGARVKLCPFCLNTSRKMPASEP